MLFIFTCLYCTKSCAKHVVHRRQLRDCMRFKLVHLAKKIKEKPAVFIHLKNPDRFVREQPITCACGRRGGEFPSKKNYRVSKVVCGG